jgi:hypothetical protein
VAWTNFDVDKVAGSSEVLASDWNTYVKANMESLYPLSMTIALSDESTAITTGTAKVTIRAPFAMTLTQIPRASLSTASSSGNPTVDINEGGTSILGANKLSIDANEKTSTTAATATTLADTSIADDAELTFDIDVAGTGAKGLKVTLYFVKT